MSRDIPFFEMFTELQLSGELRLALAGAVINSARIDQAAMALALHLTTQIELGEAEAAELRRLLSGVYGFQSVELEVVCKQAVPGRNIRPRWLRHLPLPAAKRKRLPSLVRS